MEKIETGLREVLLNDGCRILESLLNQPNALGSYVPVGELHDKRSKRVQSLIGSLNLSRSYYHSEDGRYFPMDLLLGLTDSYTPGLAKMMSRAAGTDGSFEEAEETLRIYAGVTVPASQIRKMAQKVGEDIEQWNKHREESRSKAVPTMYIAYDGTGVPMRKIETKGRKGKNPDGTSKGREVKLGCVFTNHEFDETGNPIRTPESTTYVASFQPASEFGSVILQEARLRGLGKAERAAVLGDGARWIWNIAGCNFPDAKQILDFYHACEHLTVLASALFPNNDLKISLQAGKWRKKLEKDGVLKVVAEASKMLPRSGPRRKTALREMAYFRRNKDRMMYATFKKEGYFIGSGVVEAGCKTVVGKRTKQSGMFWRITGAQHILNIRCSVLSDTYNKYWIYRRKTQLRALDHAA